MQLTIIPEGGIVHLRRGEHYSTLNAIDHFRENPDINLIAVREPIDDNSVLFHREHLIIDLEGLT